MVQHNVAVEFDIIDGLKTNFYNETVSRFLNKDKDVLSLLGEQNTTTLAQQITEDKRFNPDYRNVLVDVIKDQYERSGIVLDTDSPVLENLEKLRQKNTVTATTGQQIHIFLGPFFMANKLLSCVAEAQRIADELVDIECVPVFWLATEDHDFDEIRSVRLYNETYTWDIPNAGPVGRINPASILPLVDQAQERIDQTPENLRFIEICRTAYQSCNTFADATRFILHEIFGGTGIVILDADDKVLKKHYSAIARADILKNRVSSLIDSQIAKMKAAGIKAPINTRPINHFLINDDSRELIKLGSDDQVHIADQSLSIAAIEELLERHPERISPNALMRTIYQQSILPNVHYTCGASEFIYWLEMPEVMSQMKLIYPQLGVRASVFTLKPAHKESLGQINLELGTLFLNDENFKHLMVKRNQDELKNLLSGVTKLENSWSTVETELNSRNVQTLKLSQSFHSFKSRIDKELQRISSHSAEGSPELKKALKIKSKVWSNEYNQERNKDLISMVDELLQLNKLAQEQIDLFRNNRLIICQTP